MTASGRSFYKMCGSGNDFVFFDARAGAPAELDTEDAMRRLCARATGVGADGVVFLEPSERAALRMRYHNSDGSRATFCGNAALCTTRLAVELGIADAAGFVFEADTGLVGARIRDGIPEIDLGSVRELRPDAAGVALGPGEQRIGFAIAGVPHVVVRVDDIEHVPLDERGRTLRFDPALGSAGANVNFIAPAGEGSGWLMRTYERGVEGETLACGTGAVACAAVLTAWGAAAQPTTIVTRSGKPLIVRQRGGDGVAGPSLSGEGRIVFEGVLREL
jgi:diaminopimelate epimerase